VSAPIASSGDSTAANQAKARFIKQAQNVNKSFDGTTFLGELKETVSMLRSPLKSLREASVDYLSTLRKGRRRSSSWNKGFLSNTWLEYQYGISPLISDLDNGMTAYRRLTTDESQYKKISGTGEQTYHNSFGSTTTPLDGSGLTLQVNSIVRTVKQQRYKGLVMRRFHTSAPAVPDSFDEFNRIFGLKMTIENFVPTAWELLPYSFLVDYFANVGDIIGATCWDSSGVRWICSTSRTTAESRIGGNLLASSRMGGRTASNFVSSYATVSSGKVAKATVSRAAVSPRDMVPDFVLTLPGSNIRWANIAALGVQHAKLLPFF